MNIVELYKTISDRTSYDYFYSNFRLTGGKMVEHDRIILLK